jgi:hypothetical protein
MLSTQKKDKSIKDSSKEEKLEDKPKQQNIINIMNIDTLTNQNLLIEHNIKTHTFIIKNKTTLIGTFTAEQIFKYINADIDNFLLDITLGTSIDTITRYVCNMIDSNIVLISHTDSPITGNIDILVKLYKDLYDFEQTKMPIELEKLNENIREQVRFNNREFIYTVLLQIIRLFSAYTTSNININQQIKDLIMKYTIGAVYKMSIMVKDDVDYNLSYIKNLTHNMQNLNKIRDNMQEQINDLKKTMEIENTKIDSIILNMNSPQKQEYQDYQSKDLQECSDFSTNIAFAHAHKQIGGKNIANNLSSNLSSDSSSLYSETSLVSSNTITVTNNNKNNQTPTNPTPSLSSISNSRKISKAISSSLLGANSFN